MFSKMYEYLSLFFVLQQRQQTNFYLNTKLRFTTTRFFFIISIFSQIYWVLFTNKQTEIILRATGLYLLRARPRMQRRYKAQDILNKLRFTYVAIFYKGKENGEGRIEKQAFLPHAIRCDFKIISFATFIWNHKKTLMELWFYNNKCVELI